MNCKKEVKQCSNCGKYGHIYKKCKKPVTSCGIICYRKVHSIPYFLLVQRKDSYSFCEFSKVRYNIYDYKYILYMVENMTKEEQIFLQNIQDISDIYKKIWGNFYKKYSSYKKRKLLQKLWIGVKSKDGSIFTIYTILSQCTKYRNTPEWGFPKGRKCINETNKQCAIREFSEETCIENNKVSLLHYKPLEEIFTSSNGVCYKHIYYIASLDKNYIPSYSFQKEEIGNIQWCTLNETIEKIEKKNTKRIQIIYYVYNCIL